MQAEVNTDQNFIRFSQQGGSPTLFLEYLFRMSIMNKGREIPAVKIGVSLCSGDLFNPSNAYFEVSFDPSILPHMLKCAEFINANK